MSCISNDFHGGCLHAPEAKSHPPEIPIIYNKYERDEASEARLKLLLETWAYVQSERPEKRKHHINITLIIHKHITP